jgi:hypothetical protein
MKIALVNTNLIKPPIAPIGLDYIAEALHAHGHDVAILDLCWAEDVHAAVSGFFAGREFDLAGITLRNTDDCSLANRQSFLDEFSAIVERVRAHTFAPIVLGGVGFSAMPECAMELSGAEAGVWGDGEFVFSELARRIEDGGEWRGTPGLLWPDSADQLRCNPPAAHSLDDLPPMGREWIDNARYYAEGGQGGIETKRGCPGRCTYCADPIAKGREVRVRRPEAVADEMERLLSRGIDHLHLCDSEFNIPEWHAREVCGELIRRGLGGRLRWYTYCSPVPFSEELAGIFRRAGCAGINFGVDNGDDQMLRRLGRSHSPTDILSASGACRGEGIAVMLDLLLGSPGETRESIIRTIELVKRAEPDRAGVALGVRVYPGTEIAAVIAREGLARGLTGGGMDPLFFVEPEVADLAPGLIRSLTHGDRRFLFSDPSRPEVNYNYNANQVLSDAVKRGYRGAYWDILRRLAESSINPKSPACHTPCRRGMAGRQTPNPNGEPKQDA